MSVRCRSEDTAVKKDCPMVQDDVKLAEEIFGRNIAIFKGKSTRKKPKPVIHDTIAVPTALKLAQEDVTLCIDTFFVNKMPFLHTIPDKIHYRTSQWVPDCESSTYRMYLEVVSRCIEKQGSRSSMYVQMKSLKLCSRIWHMSSSLLRKLHQHRNTCLSSNGALESSRNSVGPHSMVTHSEVFQGS
jgi:hypothetical protein